MSSIYDVPIFDLAVDYEEAIAVLFQYKSINIQARSDYPPLY